MANKNRKPRNKKPYVKEDGRKDHNKSRNYDPHYSPSDKDTSNDPSWYNKFPELVDVAAQLSWNVSLGTKITLNPISDIDTLGSYAPSKEGGIYAVGFIPSFGVGHSLTDPVNKAAIEYWSQLRFNKSGSVGYDPADIIQMLVAVDSLYLFIGSCVRAYGLMNLATPTNRYIPEFIVKGAGFDFQDLLTHKADFNYFINSLIVQSAKINVPKDLTIFARHNFLVNNVFKDEPIDRASMFLYVPEILWKYNEETARCEAVNFFKGHDTNGAQWTYSELVALGTSLLNAIQTVEDFYTMNANILAAYDYDNLYRLATIDPLYVTLPVFREEMLIQLHNTTFMGNDYVAASMIVDQDKSETSANRGAIIFEPMFTTNSVNSMYEQFLDIPFDSPSKDDIMEASRWRIACTATASGNQYVATPVTSGSEIATAMRISRFLNDNSGNWIAGITTTFANGSTGQDTYVRFLTKLNMAPIFIEFLTLNGKTVPAFIWGDLTNFAVVEDDNLRNMHEAALYSELAVSRSNLVKR